MYSYLNKSSQAFRTEIDQVFWHLYRLVGLKGREIGDMFDVDYITVSVSRKRLRGRTQKEDNLKRLLFRVEARLSKLKNWPHNFRVEHCQA